MIGPTPEELSYQAFIDGAPPDLRPDGHGEMVMLERASMIRPEPVDWLWQDWLPAGKVALLAGAGGTGKSTITNDFAATVSSGGTWPDGTRCEARGNVLIWSGEDSAADVIVPRLLAAKADMRRVYFVTGRADGHGVIVPFDPATDVPLLGERLAGIGSANLLIIDPVVSAVTGDAHKANDVRRSLAPLGDLAARAKCSVLGITHFAKRTAGGLPVERVIGSQAFAALARVVLVTARDEVAERRVLARCKSNLSVDTGGFSYALEQVDIASGIRANHVVWGERIDGSARALLADLEAVPNDDERSERDAAADFLSGLLADGPVPVRTIQADARGAGHAWRTVERAKRDLGVEARKAGLTGGWVWALPKTAEDRQSP